MAAVAAIIQHGSIPATVFPLDENNSTTPSLLVQSLTVSASRNEKRYMGGSGQTVGVEYRDPVLDLKFDGYVSVEDSVTTSIHPGNAVTTVNNFSASRHGFSPSDGTKVCIDPNTSGSNEDLMKVDYTIRCFQFVV